MTTYRPLFVANTARSGSFMIGLMLSTNSKAMIASEGFLELFRSFRNGVIRETAPRSIREQFDPASPFDDYYFSNTGIEILDLIQDGELSCPFDPAEWNQFLAVCKPRISIQCKDFVPHLDGLRAEDYKGVFDNALAMIARTRDATDCKWIGIQDAWTIEFFGPLARAYPEAKFISIIRDPRAFINSHLRRGSERPHTASPALSLARHSRKLMAFTHQYQRDPLFDGRLAVVTHEQVLSDPEEQARRLCSFLEVDFEPAMLDTEQYYDHASGSIWEGNSAFEKQTRGLSMHRAHRWRDTLDPKVLRLVEFVCNPDMRTMGYEPLEDGLGQWPSPDVLDAVQESNRTCQYQCSWRSDRADPQLELGRELFRRTLLTHPRPIEDEGIIRRSFLFPEMYDRLRRQERELSPTA